MRAQRASSSQSENMLLDATGGEISVMLSTHCLEARRHGTQRNYIVSFHDNVQHSTRKSCAWAT